MKRMLTCLALPAAIFLTVGGGLASGQGAPATRATSTAAASQPAASPYTTDIRAEISSLPAAPLTPKNAGDLKAIQDRVEAVQRFAMPATVGITMADGQGSGVIVSKDGYVLTAGHVSGANGADVTIILSNGQRVQAKSLGANNQIDSGMIKITTPGDYPFVPVGTISKLVAGQWVVAMGHPGGYRQGRPPVVRLGRVLSVRPGDRGYVGTDSPLINGDSGGPLFDLDGRLIGINSRIGAPTTTNLHVPIDTFTGTWNRLAKGEMWGGTVFARGGRGGGGGNVLPETVPVPARLGVKLKEDPLGLVITLVSAGTGAETAGLKENDIVTSLDGKAVKTVDEVTSLIAQRKPGDIVRIDILRSAQAKQLVVTLGL